MFCLKELPVMVDQEISEKNMIEMSESREMKANKLQSNHRDLNPENEKIFIAASASSAAIEAAILAAVLVILDIIDEAMLHAINPEFNQIDLTQHLN